MISNCTRCSRLYEVRGDEAANEPGRLCPPCHWLAQLLTTVDGLGAWRRNVDVISGNTAADQLAALLDQAELAALRLRTQ